jgi:Kef-type K+ transport system membrane component KefB
MQMAFQMATLVLCLGIIIIIAIMTKEVFFKLKLPPLIGYIAIGIVFRLTDSHYDLLGDESERVLHLFGELGVIILLFHIGLESNLKKLVKKLGQATLIGISGVVVSALLGFAAAYFILQLDFLISLFVAAALVATSIGVSAGIWEQNNAIDTDQGQLLLDIAEFDDIIGVIIMALFFALAPVIGSQNARELIIPELSRTFITFMAKLFLFGLACILFSRYLEKPVTEFFKNLEKAPEESLTIVAIGLMIAALAGLLGFSVAIGAFFAGLIFSRDPASIKTKTVVGIVYDLFVPFFFIGIGLRTRATAIAPSLLPALVLIAVAFVGKSIGTLGPALLFCDRSSAALLGLSMVPRAEVAMIIMQRSLTLRAGSMPEEIYTAMVIVCIATCIIPPLVLNRLIDSIVRPGDS